MYEIKRILFNKKTILLTIIMVLLNCVLFSLDCAENKAITLMDGELVEYVNVTYPEFLKNTSEQAKKLNLLALSGDDGDFVKKNIDKSNEDYKQLSDIVPEYGENRGITAFSNFRLTDIIFIGVLLIIVFSFGEDDKKGLTSLIRSTVNGRTKLALYRVSTLFAAAFALCVLLYGGNIIAATISFGDTGLFRPIQSVPEFIRCVYKISVGQYFIFSVIIKYIAGVTAAVMLYLLINMLGIVITALGFAGFSVMSLFFYLFILPTSSTNILKFANLIALIKTDDFFKEYCNLNIFGNPLSMLPVSLFLIIMLFITFTGANLFVSAKMYKGTINNPFSAITHKALSFLSKKMPQPPLFISEGKKILIKQKGVIFIAVCFYLALSSALGYRYFYPVDKYELQWHDTYDGVITAELIDAMHAEQDGLKEIINSKEERIRTLLSSGSNSGSIEKLQSEITKLTKELNALDRVAALAEDGMNYYEKSGNKICLIKQYSYNLLLVDDVKTTKRNNIYILLGVIGALAGVMANERQYGMTLTIRTTLRGRAELLAIKLIWVFLISAIFAVSVHLIQFTMINTATVYNDMDAPVQSLAFMRDFPFYVSIKEFFVLLFASRAAAAFVCGIAVSVVSRFRRDRVSVMAVCVFLIVVPFILI